MVRKEVETVAHLPLGVVALEMIMEGGVRHPGTDLQGEASLAAGAGPFLERGGERDHWLGKEITNRLHPL
jgi:hypothetical protein